jgi:hypothetical protein
MREKVFVNYYLKLVLLIVYINLIMNNLFFRFRIFFRNLYSGKTKSSKEKNIVNNSPSSLASLTASNKIYEENELLINDVNIDTNLDAEVCVRMEPCKCRVCYLIKNILRFHSYKCSNERKKDFFEDI